MQQKEIKKEEVLYGNLRGLTIRNVLFTYLLTGKTTKRPVDIPLVL